MYFIPALHLDLCGLARWLESNPLRVDTIPLPIVLDTVCASLLLSVSTPQADWLNFQAWVSFTVRQHAHVGCQAPCFMTGGGGGGEDVPAMGRSDLYPCCTSSRREYFWTESLVMEHFCLSLLKSLETLFDGKVGLSIPLFAVALI